MMNRIRRVLLIAAAAPIGLLTACVDVHNNDNPAGVTCQTLNAGQGGATASTSCASNCSVANPSAAADGNFSSYAAITEAAGTSGMVAVTSVPKTGVTYAAGTPAGVIYDADGATQSSVLFTVTTFLAGVQQDTGTVSSDGAGSPARPIEHTSIATTRPFDSVQFSFTRSAGTTAETVRVYELCSN